MHVVKTACMAAAASSAMVTKPGPSACSRTRMAQSIAQWPVSCRWAPAASSGSHPSHLKVGTPERRSLPWPPRLSLLPLNEPKALLQLVWMLHRPSPSLQSAQQAVLAWVHKQALRMHQAAFP